MPTTWKNKVIEQGFNYADYTIKEMTDFFETRVENLKPNEKMKKSSAAAKQFTKKSLKKRKQEDFDSSVVESSDESTEARHPSYCILHRKCSFSTVSCKDLPAMVNKHQQKKKNSKATERATRS